MNKYSDITRFIEDYDKKYKKPVVDEYIVGFTGIDPDEKVKDDSIDHEKLSGLLGGNLTGHFHLTSEQVNQIRLLRKSVDAINRIIDTTLSEFGDRIADVEENQDTITQNLTSAVADFQAARDLLTARMNAIASQATEDTEIFDARVDAEGVIHSNLGENVRNIHGKLIHYEEYESQSRKIRDDDLASQIDEVSCALLMELNGLSLERLRREELFQNFVMNIREVHKNLSEQIDEVSAAVISEIYRDIRR